MASIPLLLLLLIGQISAQYSTTRLDVNGLIFSTGKSYINYFKGVQGNGINVQCECHASTGSGEARGMSKPFSADNMDHSTLIGDFSFEQLNNPAKWITVTCSVRLRLLDENLIPTNVVDYVQIYAGADDETFAPNTPITISKRFETQNDWQMTGTVVKVCSSGTMANFNCDSRCTPTTCNGGAPICCPEDVNKDACTCRANPFTSDPTPITISPSPGDRDPDFCTNEDLYFWIMIGLACLSGLLLLLLIICLCYICCALSSEDEARKAAQAEAARPPPPPVYLSTPPRDPRYGYRGPDPYARPPVESRYREDTYEADIDSLAAEWSEPSARREARV